MADKDAILLDGGLGAPAIGWFEPSVPEGTVLSVGQRLGTLWVLHRPHAVLTPEGCSGAVAGVGPPGVRRAVAYGELLLRLEAVAEGGAAVASRTETPTTSGAFVLRAPIHGIFYARANPQSPTYVSVGSVVDEGQCVGLIEVMKTFHPVSWRGPRGEIGAVLVKDLQEISAGQPLFRLAAGAVE